MTADKAVVLHTDITDWAEEVLREEPDLQDKDEAIETQMTRTFSPQKMGRMIVAGRELGIADGELVPPTKALIQTGATRAWSETLKQEMVSIETQNGKTVKVRRLVGPVTDPEGGTGEPWVECSDPKALERAEAYLMDVVPRHVYSRLVVLLAGGGDVEAAGEGVKARIDEIVSELLA